MVTPRSQLTCHSGCPSARGFSCTCTCFGVCHGTAPVAWAETIASASTGTAPAGVVRAAHDAQRLRGEISAHVRAQVQLIRSARSRPRNRRGVNVRDRGALVSGVRAGKAVDWLIDHPDARSMAHAALDEVAKVAFDEAAHFGPHRAPRLGHHLWCSIFAALADAVDEVGKLQKKAIDWASTAVAKELVRATLAIMTSPPPEPARGCMDECHPEPGALATNPVLAALLERLVARAVQQILKRIAPTIDVETAVKTLRVLAVLICPTPQRHPRVWRGCLVPLAKEMGGEEIGYLVDWIFGPEVPGSGTTVA